jgi:endoglucanase
MKWLLSFMSFHILFLSSLQGQDTVTKICIDQEGYYPKSPKIAIIASANVTIGNFPLNESTFFVISDPGGDTVFHGTLSPVRLSSNSSTETRIADFSPLTLPGNFRLAVKDCCRSYSFHIKGGVHHPLAVASLKAFYYQRASTALPVEYAGQWHRNSGHPDDSVFVHPSAVSAKRQAGYSISTPGGWYDAGDYNKYIVNSGITMGTLLSAYEDFGKYFDTLHTNIPGLPGKIPDILNETLYNIRWMLSMQDPEDGGVYHKCTNPVFDPMVMPDVCHQPRYVVQKGTAATLDFAAVTAQAARIFIKYKKELPGLSDSCQRQSEKAWGWAINHPDMIYDQNLMNQLYTPKIVTGAYGDRKFSDEWYWAACELYITTGKKTYLDTIRRLMREPFGLPSWSETGFLGHYSLINHNMPDITTIEMDSIRRHLLQAAENYVRDSKNSAFLTVMGNRKSDFNWGSNANAANQGILLIHAYNLTKDKKYLDAALGNLDYLCGRNATGYCFVTGIGSFSTTHPHHRPSVADGIVAPVPGLLAGGPNPGEQDHCQYFFHEPETAYVDSDCAYASNEIAINWNAPLVYLANALEALENNF